MVCQMLCVFFWCLKMFWKKPCVFQVSRAVFFDISFDHAVYCFCSHTTFPCMRYVLGNSMCIWFFDGWNSHVISGKDTIPKAMLRPGIRDAMIDFRAGNGMWCKFWFKEHVGWDQILFFCLISLKLYRLYIYNYIYYTLYIFKKGSSFGSLMCLQKKGNPFAFFGFRCATNNIKQQGGHETASPFP